MPGLCSKFAYYAGIMLDALACLLCLKLCRHNRRMPNNVSAAGGAAAVSTSEIVQAEISHQPEGQATTMVELEQAYPAKLS